MKFKQIKRIFRKYIRTGETSVTQLMRLSELPNFIEILQEHIERTNLSISQLRDLMKEIEIIDKGISNKGITFKTYLLKDDLEFNRDEVCSVCMIDYETNDEVSETKCGHTYHSECLKNWHDATGIHFNCPICRTDL